jgi:hypothetical protein
MFVMGAGRGNITFTISLLQINVTIHVVLTTLATEWRNLILVDMKMSRALSRQFKSHPWHLPCMFDSTFEKQRYNINLNNKSIIFYELKFLRSVMI